MLSLLTFQQLFFMFVFQLQGTEGGFKVPAGDLGFSVGLFTGLSIVCLGIIMIRRLVCHDKEVCAMIRRLVP